MPLIGAVEDSLRRLGIDYLDLYQVHRPSPDTDVEETLGALSGLVHQDKVRCIGSSSHSGSQIVEAQWVGICRKPVVPACGFPGPGQVRGARCDLRVTFGVW